MARGNGRTISVKLPTAKVIIALQQALTKLELDYTSQDQAEVEYQKSAEIWRKEVIKFAIDNISKAENMRTNYRQWSGSLRQLIGLDHHGDLPRPIPASAHPPLGGRLNGHSF